MTPEELAPDPFREGWARYHAAHRPEGTDEFRAFRCGYEALARVRPASRVDEDETRAELETIVRDLAADGLIAGEHFKQCRICTAVVSSGGVVHADDCPVERAFRLVARLSEPSPEGTQ